MVFIHASLRRFSCPIRVFLSLLLGFTVASNAVADEDWLASVLSRAGENQVELQTAWQKVPEAQRPGMKFLLQNMPERDAQALTAEYLLNNTAEAYAAREAAVWELPEDIFLNNVLPYANINESRDDYRKQFRERFSSFVKDAKTPGEAAAVLNNKIFPELQVKYSRKRRRADQGPLETMKSGLASCTGLSILLIDACRSVGVPARFVGTPLWSDRSGNHSWVEVWDDGWHFTGAAEPTGMELDKGWFIGRASKALRDDPRYAIYAVSFKKTPLHFPLVWDRSIKYVSAVNVTDRYADKAKQLPPNYLEAMFATYGIGGDRCCVPIKIRDNSGQVVFEGQTKDESFDGNDHTSVALPIGKTFQVELPSGKLETITTKPNDDKSQLFSFALASDTPNTEASSSSSSSSSSAIQALSEFVKDDSSTWENLASQPFAMVPLRKQDAAEAKELVVAFRQKRLLQKRQEEHRSGELVWDGKKMPFAFKTFGERPEGGRSLFISMHGGGNAPARVNDRQWENQKRLYEPSEGVYVAPRAPTDTWNLWHEPHIMPLFDRLIENMVLFEGVDPNRVYLMGYSAGGDGVYQMAPRMADRLAAAAMMAGHPNDAQPDNLANIGFAIYMGGKDAAYKRNQVAAEWGEKLDALEKQHPQHYAHLVTIYPDKGHWMDRQDASALPWMMKFTRKPLPSTVFWRKDGNPQERFYWLGASKDGWTKGAKIVAKIEGQTIDVQADEGARFQLLLNDDLLDLDKQVTVKLNGETISQTAQRTISTMCESLSQRFDPSCVFSAKMQVE